MSEIDSIIITVTELLQPHASGREADRRAREWLNNLDHQSAVGKRHHIVPRFLLARFASSGGQLRVRNRAGGAPSLRSISDLAVKDFYTAVTNDAKLDSSLESLLSVVEGGAAEVLRRHLDFRAFAVPRSFTPEERAILDNLVATQAIRGMRLRRQIEVLTDYSVKLLHKGMLSDEDERDLEFVPHPNEHLRMFGNLADHVESALKERPLSLVSLHQPLLITGDEPVVIVNGDLASASAPSEDSRIESEELVAFERTFGGLMNAEAVLLAVSPSELLLYGRPGAREWRPGRTLSGGDAVSFTREHNSLVLAGAIDWVAANPEHPTFGSMRMPAPGSVLKVHDYGSVAASRVNSTPAGRPIRRLRSDDIFRIDTPE